VSNVTGFVVDAARLENALDDPVSEFACGAVEIETVPNVSIVR
jgi:hypothetical protein